MDLVTGKARPRSRRDTRASPPGKRKRPSPESLVIAEGLSKSYRRGRETVEALRGVDLLLRRGEFVALVGPSGSGKSTLLNLIGGLDRPSGGTLTVAGIDLPQATGPELDEYRRRRVGFVFQFHNLIPSLTARENVALALVARGSVWTQALWAADQALEKVGLGSRAAHKPGELSGGEQQRTAIARAIVGAPDLILADEPTGDLDGVTAARILRLFRRLHGPRDAFLIATHNPIVAREADRVLILRDGRFDERRHVPRP